MQEHAPWRDRLAVCADIIQVTSFFGLSVSVIIAAIVAIIGIFSETPPMWNAVITVTVGLATLLAWNTCIRKNISRARGTQALGVLHEDNFNISDWEKVDAFLVGHAACLWANIKPTRQIDENHPAYPSLQKIKGAIATGYVTVIKGDGGLNSTISREELIKLATSKKEMPKFLFPETRIELEFISLRDAATELYEASRSNKRLLAIMTEQLSGYSDGQMIPGSPDDRLNFLATHISRHIPIYGKKDPSRILEKIDDKELKGASFHDGAMILKDKIYDKSIYWKDLAVKTSEFKAKIEAMTI